MSSRSKIFILAPTSAESVPVFIALSYYTKKQLEIKIKRGNRSGYYKK